MGDETKEEVLLMDEVPQETAGEPSYHSLSDEELEKMLAGAEKAADEAQSTEGDGETEEGAQKTPEPKDADKTPEEKAPVAEEPKPEASTVTLSKEDYDKLLKQKDAKEHMIQRQGNQIGELRKRLQQVIREKEEEVERKGWAAKPSEVFEAQQAIEKAKDFDKHLEVREQVENNRDTILRLVPDFDTKLDTLVDIVREDGFSEEVVNNFRANPFLDNHGVLFNLVKRAELKQASASLREENAKLKAEVEALKKSKGDVATKIEQTLRGTPQKVKAASGGVPSKAVTVPPQLHELPYDALESMLKERLQQEA